MKITFYSNYMNHHQLYLSQELEKLLGDNYKFVATVKIHQERLDLGYEDMNSDYDFIVESYKSDDDYNLAMELGLSSDIVIIGSAPYSFIEERIKEGKIVLIYSERFFKGGLKDPSNILRWFKYFLKHTLKHRNNVYLLAASAYAPLDFSLIKAYNNKMFNWGYFPSVINYSNDEYLDLVNNKDRKKILWVGRMLDWKHPEEIIYLANYLRSKNMEFSIDVVGNGEMYDSLVKQITENNLEDYITLVGSVSSEEVRKYMEDSSIFIFTSDSNEGWGAVLNEAMNSACAVVASSAIGSVPFMIEDSKNGFIYENGNSLDLQSKVEYLLNDPNLSREVGDAAYATVQEQWNPKTAAERLVHLSESLIDGKITYYDKGPLSKAKIIK